MTRLRCFWRALDLLIEASGRSLREVSEGEVGELVEEIVGHRGGGRIFVVGAGRSGLVGRAFAMRLMHLGLNAYVVGETITPALKSGDTLIAISGSGRTRTVVEIARLARKAGGRVIAITSSKRSPLARISDHAIRIPSKLEGEGLECAPPLGTLFELSCWIFLDAVVAELMERLAVREEDMRSRHTNLDWC